MRAQNQFRDHSLIARDNSKTILAGIRELAPEIAARMQRRLLLEDGVLKPV